MTEALASLPYPALITFGATLAIIFAVKYLGVWKPAAETPPTAALVVDAGAIRAATEAVKDLTGGLGESTKAYEHMARELERLREEVRINREVLRR